MIRQAAAVVIAVVTATLVAPAAPAQDAGTVAAIHTELLDQGLTEVERQVGLMRQTFSLVDAGTTAMVEAQRDGADLKALRVREEDLQELESQLIMRLFEIQRARRDVLTNLAVIEAANEVTATPAGAVGALTGRWKLNVQPGLSGTAYLVQQGTLVSGTYELSGGWTGSLRGTLVANKVRLERIDSQLGFAAIFYGEVDLDADPPAIRGRWEATQLATGMPSAGGWMAVQED